MDAAATVSVPTWAWGLIVAVLFSTGGLLISVLAYLGKSIKESISTLAATVQRIDDRLRSVEGEVLVLRVKQSRKEDADDAKRTAAGM